VNAAKLIKTGITPALACDTAVAHALSDDPELLQTIHELASAVF
jgi:nitric oxide reductase NorQ protein